METNILQWFADRLITEATIKKYGITWDNNKIDIPIQDQNQKLLFYKHRRLPSRDTGPKYWYDAGTTVSPYPAWLPKGESITICEGEFDCIVLNEMGVPAMTTTGGAGNFNPEWVKDIPNVEICFDTDTAGRTEGFKLAVKLGAKLVILDAGKDITEYFQSGKTVEDFKRLPRYPIEKDPEVPEKLSKAYVKRLQQASDQRLKTIIKMRQQGILNTNDFMDANKKMYEDIAQLEKKLTKKKPSRQDGAGLDIQKAKQVPISDFFPTRLRKGGSGRMLACCPFHQETTPSFVYYVNQNSFHCYGCNENGDVIDFIQKLDGLSFVDAVKKILNIN